MTLLLHITEQCIVQQISPHLCFFFGQPGFNNPLSGSIITENEDDRIVPSIDAGFLLDISDENADEYIQWNLEIASSLSDEVFEPINSTNDIINENITDEVARHFKSYRERIIENKNSNRVLQDLSIGDKVLLRKDFDMNKKTKKAPIDSFYYTSVFTVTLFLTNNMVEVKSSEGNIRTVFRGIIKRI